MFAFGIGFVGTRVRVLPLQFGVGSLFYTARPKRHTVVEVTIEDGVEAQPDTANPAQPESAERAAETAAPENAGKQEQSIE